jgi:glycosyltransferase involved in cell wall biosynthesis
MRIIFTVTNDLNYDQRMIRICNSLVVNGYEVKLVGRKFNDSAPLENKSFRQKRIKLFFKKTFGFYGEYNIKLFFYLLFQKADVLCCIDLDTMLPVYFASLLKRKARVYDAHEYFSQLKEIVTRPGVYRVWHFIERNFVPKFINGYTVSEGIADELLRNYNVKYEVIRNVPLLKPARNGVTFGDEKILLYQGSVNEGRGFEYLIPAMKNVGAVLHIYGDGNFLEEATKMANGSQLQSKVVFKGKFLPKGLDLITQNAYAGINLVEPFGKSQLLSLTNKFFDYIQNELPQVTMDFPEYKKINDECEVALLLEDLSIASVEKSLNILLEDHLFYNRLKQNCKKAREKYNWENEEKKLLRFYNRFNQKTNPA